MVGMGIDNIVHHDRELCHARILNTWIDDWNSGILIKLDQENEQRLPQKYSNLRLLDDEKNQTYMIVPENLDFKGPTRRSKQNCVFGQPYNVNLLISRNINGDLMLLIKGFEQEPDPGVNFFHPSNNDDSEATW